MRTSTLLPVLALSAIAIAGCDDDPSPGATSASAEPMVVVASVHPATALIRELVGDGAEVRTLLPPGAHADTYEPTPRMAGAMEGAALVVKVGAGLDEWIGTPAATRVLTLTEGLSLREGNPHVWLDPVLVRDRLLPRLAEALAAAAPDQVGAIRSRAAAFTDSLTALDDEIRGLLEGASTRLFVAAHPAWVYFAERYDLTQVGVLHPSPGEEIGTRELARLVREARQDGVRAVIAEPQLARAGVAALADELDVRVEVADPIGGDGLEGRGSYLSLMRSNAHAFARALGGARAPGGAP